MTGMTVRASRDDADRSYGLQGTRPRPCVIGAGSRLLRQVIDRLDRPDPPGIAGLGAGRYPRVIMLEATDTQLDPRSGEPIALSNRIGRGAHHTAHAIDHVSPTGRRASRWMALIAKPLQGSPRNDRLHERYQMALDEHDHAIGLTSVAPELLPPYGGLGVIVTRPRPGLGGDARARFATIWGRKDGTLHDVIEAGGLAGDAQFHGRRFRPEDLAQTMHQMGDAYRRLHHQGMVYTDPKPANLAFSVDQEVPSAAVRAGARRPRGAAEASAQGASWIRDLVFIDPESMQPPGYLQDPRIPAVGIFTLESAAEDILRDAFIGTQALKRAQGDPRNDLYHLSAVAYGLVAGVMPQAALAHERHESHLRALPGLGADEAKRLQIDNMRLTRRDAGFAQEHAELEGLVRARRLPAELSRLISDGLEGRLTSLDDWIRRSSRALDVRRGT